MVIQSGVLGFFARFCKVFKAYMINYYCYHYFKMILVIIIVIIVIIFYYMSFVVFLLLMGFGRVLKLFIGFRRGLIMVYRVLYGFYNAVWGFVGVFNVYRVSALVRFQKATGRGCFVVEQKLLMPAFEKASPWSCPKNEPLRSCELSKRALLGLV